MKRDAYFCTVKELQEAGRENIPDQFRSNTHLIYSSPAPLVGKGWLDNLTNPVTVNPPIMDSLIRRSLTSDINVCFENNSSDIRIDKIIHTDSKSIEECYFVPLKKGTFQVECQIMCEEYLKPDVQYFTFHVEK